MSDQSWRECLDPAASQVMRCRCGGWPACSSTDAASSAETVFHRAALWVPSSTPSSLMTADLSPETRELLFFLQHHGCVEGSPKQAGAPQSFCSADPSQCQHDRQTGSKTLGKSSSADLMVLTKHSVPDDQSSSIILVNAITVPSCRENTGCS